MKSFIRKRGKEEIVDFSFSKQYLHLKNEGQILVYKKRNDI